MLYVPCAVDSMSTSISIILFYFIMLINQNGRYKMEVVIGSQLVLFCLVNE